METIPFCRKFFSATGLPVTLISAGKPVYTSLGEMISYQPEISWMVYSSDHNPEFNAATPDLEYGHVHIEDTGDDLFIGPIFTTPVNEEIIAKFLAEVRVPQPYHEALTEILYHVPVGSHPQFLRYLMFIHLCLNHRDEGIEELYKENTATSQRREQRSMITSIDVKENMGQRDAYPFEMQLYHHVQSGNTGKLKQFLERTPSFPNEGKMASSPLRHAKNRFIALTSKAAVLGAIPGGADMERIYQLTDLYVMECEQMQSIEEIYRLQYIMLMDFCQRVNEAKIPKGISAEIYRCMNYIRNHTNRMITVEEIASEIRRSTSYLTRRFKIETGKTVGEFIADCKLEEACEMLVYSDQPLAQISAYLGYSSQAYFQNLFKKRYGITPMNYRKKRQMNILNRYSARNMKEIKNNGGNE